MKRLVFFAINFSVAILFFDACIIGLVVPFYGDGSAAGICGGILFTIPSALFARAEWLAFYRGDAVRERRLGRVCLGLAAFAAFAAAMVTGEALTKSWPQGFGWFVAILLSFSAYFAACGFSRFRKQPKPSKETSWFEEIE